MELLTTEELSELLRVSRNHVVVMARRGDIPAFTIDGRLRFEIGEIEEWLQSRRINAIVSSPPKVVDDG